MRCCCFRRFLFLFFYSLGDSLGASVPGPETWNNTFLCAPDWPGQEKKTGPATFRRITSTRGRIDASDFNERRRSRSQCLVVVLRGSVGRFSLSLFLLRVVADVVVVFRGSFLGATALHRRWWRRCVPGFDSDPVLEATRRLNLPASAGNRRPQVRKLSAASLTNDAVDDKVGRLGVQLPAHRHRDTLTVMRRYCFRCVGLVGWWVGFLAVEPWEDGGAETLE